MKAFLIAAALALAASSAQAQYVFEYGGRTIRVDPDRGTVSIPGVYESEPRRERRNRSSTERRGRKDNQTPKADATPETATAPVDKDPGGAAGSTAAAAAGQDAGPAPVTPAAPAAGALTRDLRPGEGVAVATAASGPSPVGLWLTEEKEGIIRIETCGDNLCGYAVDRKSRRNGDLVLFDMKAANGSGRDVRWTGKIVDPANGSTYESWIALKSPDALRVQGCAFGAMFCGGQTWSRTN